MSWKLKRSDPVDITGINNETDGDDDIVFDENPSLAYYAGRLGRRNSL